MHLFNAVASPMKLMSFLNNNHSWTIMPYGLFASPIMLMPTVEGQNKDRPVD